MGSGHAHDHGPSAPVEGPLRFVLPGIVGVLVVATAIGVLAYWPSGEQDERLFTDGGTFEVEFVDGIVRSVDEGPCPGTDPSAGVMCELLRVEVTSGPTAAEDGEEPTIATIQQVPTAASASASAGDRVVLGYTPDSDEGFQYYFSDFQRRAPLIWLAVLFGAAVVALGRWQGVRALVALGLSLVVVVGFVLPSLLDGNPPVAVALVGASVVAIVALYLTHGPNHGTTVALLGTMASLALTGVLAAIWVSASKLTGLATEEATFLQVSADQVDLQGLLLAGIVIGTLGVLDDVTVTQVAAVEEIHRADPSAPPARVWRGAMRVGRDHIGSTVNTLVLAYAGAALPLLLLFTQTTQPLSSVLNGEVVAAEVIRTLVGSLGLVASVPITTGLAVWVVRSQHPGALSTPAAPTAAVADDLESDLPAAPVDASPEQQPTDPERDLPAQPAGSSPEGAAPSPAPPAPPEPPEPPPPPPAAPPQPPAEPPSWDDFAPREDPDTP